MLLIIFNKLKMKNKSIKFPSNLKDKITQRGLDNPTHLPNDIENYRAPAPCQLLWILTDSQIKPAIAEHQVLNWLGFNTYSMQTVQTYKILL